MIAYTALLLSLLALLTAIAAVIVGITNRK